LHNLPSELVQQLLIIILGQVLEGLVEALVKVLFHLVRGSHFKSIEYLVPGGRLK
jgi:hypothetical protein